MDLGYFVERMDIMGFLYWGEQGFRWRVIMEGDFRETGAELWVFFGVYLCIIYDLVHLKE